MSFTKPFEAVSEEALMDNTLTLITATFKNALDAYYPTENLADFAERSLGMIMGLETPALAIAPRRNASTLADDSSHLREALEFDLAVGVIDENPQAVTRKITRYMRVLEMTLRAGRKSDFFGTVNTTRTFGFSLDCEHIYSQDIRANASTYFRDATLRLTVQIRER
jgi:hypothetical protein